MKPSIAIVGCGKVGLNLIKFLKEAGYTFSGVASKSIESAQSAGSIAGTTSITTEAHTITPNADIIFITTPDGVIEETCTEIAKKNGFSKDAIVYHCSGSLPSTLLHAAKENGAITGSIHPLQSFATTNNEKNPFEGIIAAIEGEAKAVETGLILAGDLKARGFKIETDSKTMYHASAVVASNFLVTLAEFAYDLLSVSGIERKDAYAVLGPLIEGTLSNIKNVGPVDALTGPVVRGDFGTVEDHLNEISKKTPELTSLYKILGFHTVSIAKKRGTLNETAEQKLLDLFK